MFVLRRPTSLALLLAGVCALVGCGKDYGACIQRYEDLQAQCEELRPQGYEASRETCLAAVRQEDACEDIKGKYSHEVHVTMSGP